MTCLYVSTTISMAEVLTQRKEEYRGLYDEGINRLQ